MSYTISIQEPAERLVARLSCREMPPLPRVRRQLYDYQLMVLWHLARQYDRKGARILEIGTGHGGSGYMLSRAAPKAKVVSLTTSQAEAEAARRYWHSQGCVNIRAFVGCSWEQLKASEGNYEMVFVDGDHNRIALDLPWFDRLTDDGLLICHDYSPQDAVSPSAIVFDELNKMAERLGRPFDVRVVDEGKVGMAGFYRQKPVLTPKPEPPPRPAPTRGLVLREDCQGVGHRAEALGLGLNVGDSWELPWPRVAFVRSSAVVPWDLLPFAFDHVLDKWDVAAPLSGELLEDLVAAGRAPYFDFRAACGQWEDLRVPAYSTDIVLARDTDEGARFVAMWRKLCASEMPDEIAFMVALAEVKPLFCALPRAWLWTEKERRDADAKAANGKLVKTREHAARMAEAAPRRGQRRRGRARR